MRPYVSVASISVGILFAVVHVIAMATSLYWYYSWLDSVMHLWGGALVVVYLRLLLSAEWRTPLLVGSYLLSLVVAWEVFEWSIGYSQPLLAWQDTLHDIVLGLLGGWLAYWWLVR
jgi:hypothetical protein